MRSKIINIVPVSTINSNLACTRTKSLSLANHGQIQHKAAFTYKGGNRRFPAELHPEVWQTPPLAVAAIHTGCHRLR